MYFYLIEFISIELLKFDVGDMVSSLVNEFLELCPWFELLDDSSYAST